KPAAALAFALAAFALAAQGVAAKAPSPGKQDPRAAALVTAFERKLNLEALDVTSTFTLVQKKQGEADRVLRIRILRRDRAESFTLVFEYPDTEKGKGYWRSGDDLYLYLPGTREFVYRNRKDDVGSTDVRTDLFGGTDTLSQYWASYAGAAMVAKWETEVVRLDARQLDVSFPIQRWYIRKSDGLPVKVENFSASGTLLRTTYYVDYQQVAPDKYIFTKLLATDELDKGQKTFITNEGIATSKIPDYVFSKAYLEEQSR
ncbi:MAG: outer membrane lipoprotein-sorting protein, partial [Spirochaetaceae bacterium]|nr:outer membrane lipoprotein-sorting protein [Spirochaetaceae bacterium]